MLTRQDVSAIVHAHPIFSTIIDIMGPPIPPVHYIVAVDGGDDIRCPPYATFRSQKLSEHADMARTDRKACLLEHHGIIAVGTTLYKALWLSVEVETPARQYHGVPQLGEPRLRPRKRAPASSRRWPATGTTTDSSRDEAIPTGKPSLRLSGLATPRTSSARSASSPSPVGLRDRPVAQRLRHHLFHGRGRAQQRCPSASP